MVSRGVYFRVWKEIGGRKVSCLHVFPLCSCLFEIIAYCGCKWGELLGMAMVPYTFLKGPMFHYVSCNIFCVCVFLSLQSEHKVYCGLGEFGMSVTAMLGGGCLGVDYLG